MNNGVFLEKVRLAKLARRVKFDSQALKNFVLDYRRRSTFSKILDNLHIKLPVRLQDFKEEEGSFFTNYGQKIVLDKKNDTIYVQEGKQEKTYVVEELSEVVLISTKPIKTY